LVAFLAKPIHALSKDARLVPEYDLRKNTTLLCPAARSRACWLLRLHQSLLAASNSAAVVGGIQRGRGRDFRSRVYALDRLGRIVFFAWARRAPQTPPSPPTEPPKNYLALESQMGVSPATSTAIIDGGVSTSTSIPCERGFEPVYPAGVQHNNCLPRTAKGSPLNAI